MSVAEPIDADHLPEGEEKVAAVRAMFDSIAPRYDLVNRLMTFGLDVRWRRRTVANLGLVPGSLVADLACGTGDLCGDLSAAGFHPLGFDLSFNMLANAPREFPRAQADALRLPLRPSSVDAVTCGFALRNFMSLPPFLEEVSRVVRSGGRLAFLEVAEPPNPLMRLGHGVYFERVVPVVGGVLSDPAAYRYLPKSVAYLPDAPTMLEMIREAGWRDVRRKLLTGGIAQLITATRT